MDGCGGIGYGLRLSTVQLSLAWVWTERSKIQQNQPQMGCDHIYVNHRSFPILLFLLDGLYNCIVGTGTDEP